MKLLKNLWPIPFKVKKGKIFSLIFRLLVFLLLCALAIGTFGLFSHIKFVGEVVAILSVIAELYGIIGIVLCFLVFFGIVKTRNQKKKRRSKKK